MFDVVVIVVFETVTNVVFDTVTTIVVIVSITTVCTVVIDTVVIALVAATATRQPCLDLASHLVGTAARADGRGLHVVADHDASVRVPSQANDIVTIVVIDTVDIVVIFSTVITVIEEIFGTVIEEIFAVHDTAGLSLYSSRRPPMAASSASTFDGQSAGLHTAASTPT